MVKVKIKKLDEKAAVPFQKHTTDGAYDLVATSLKFENGAFVYGLGFSTEIPEGYRVNIVPRSSFTNTDCIMQNAHGIIDPSYRGEWFVKYKPLRAFTAMPYQVGERIAQCYIEKITPIEWEEVIELSETERGTGGFGSTGK